MSSSPAWHPASTRTVKPGRRAHGAIALLLSLFLLTPLAVAAQQAPAPPSGDPDRKALPATASLLRFADALPDGARSGAAFVDLAGAAGLRARDDGLVNVEITAPQEASPIAGSLLRTHGGRIDAVWRNQTSAWLPPEGIRGLAAALPPGYLLRHAHRPHENDEGPAVTGSDLYRDGGADGSGITVGIIDRNFQNLAAAQDVTPAVVPQLIVGHDYTGDGAFGGSSPHGTGQVECVHDHAPAAEYHIFRIANSTHLGLAIDEAIAQGVQILSATQSWYNEGWADGSGTANAAIDQAGAAGILYFNSAGNRARTHWQGTFTSPDGDSWHDWDGVGDEFNDYAAGDGSTSFLYLQWDTGAGTTDYDLHIYDTADNSLIASSDAGGETFERIVWTNDTGATVTVGIAVRLWSGDPVEFEVFNHLGSAFEHIVPASSITPPTNNLHPNTLSIGAVGHPQYQAGQADPIASYSSLGPTNEGRFVLDLAAPTNTTTWAYGGGFGGTSAATPNAAGAAAALWSSRPELSAEGIRSLLVRQAALYLDWGASGLDHTYGFGGLFLHPHAPGTQWVDRLAGNTGADPGLPWYRVTDALAAATAGGRILMLGGGYPAPVTVTVPVTLESVVIDARVGAD